MTPEQKQVLWQKYTQYHSTNLDINELNFTDPIPYHSDLNAWDNTIVTITPLLPTPLLGESTYTYSRLLIKSVLDKQRFIPPEIYPNRLSDLIPLINEQFGTQIVTGDYYDTDLPPYDRNNIYQTRLVSIVMRPEAVLYTGVYQLELNPLSQYPNATETKPAGYWTIYQQTLVASRTSIRLSDSEGVQLGLFNLFSNVGEIRSFTISTSILLSASAKLLVLGDFAFDLITSTEIIPTVTKAILVSDRGVVSVPSGAEVFNTIIIKAMAYAKNLDRLYILTDTDNIVKMDSQLVVDPDYNLVYSHPIRFIRVGVDGLLYIVSEMITELNPYNNLVLSMNRVDRFLASGEVDPDYYPLYLHNSVGGEPIPIYDLCIAENNSYYLLFSPYHTDVLSPIPMINGYGIVPLEYNGVSNTLWNPIVRMTLSPTSPNNYIDFSFSTILEEYQPSFFTDGDDTSMVVGKRYLFSDSEGVSVILKRENPITRISHYQPVRFDLTGKPVLLSGLQYQSLPAITNYHMANQEENGSLLVTGMNYYYASQEGNIGGWSVPITYRFTKQAYPDGLLFRADQLLQTYPQDTFPQWSA